MRKFLKVINHLGPLLVGSSIAIPLSMQKSTTSRIYQNPNRMCTSSTQNIFSKSLNYIVDTLLNKNVDEKITSSLLEELITKYPDFYNAVSSNLGLENESVFSKIIMLQDLSLEQIRKFAAFTDQQKALFLLMKDFMFMPKNEFNRLLEHLNDTQGVSDLTKIQGLSGWELPTTITVKAGDVINVSEVFAETVKDQDIFGGRHTGTIDDMTLHIRQTSSDSLKVVELEQNQ